jgi:predicted alpha/beta-hydrolase family hydrolase
MRVYLGHGASGSAASMAPWVEGLRARGIEAVAIDLPKRKAEDAVAALEAIVPAGPDIVVGGHSYGGRVASLSAASREAGDDLPTGGLAADSLVAFGVNGSSPEARRPYAGLVCLSYPLHRPGHPETAAARTAHWPRIACPVLLLSGESDPFARVDLLRAAIRSLPRAELVTYPRLGHNLKPVMGDVLDRVAAFLRGLKSG